jgi:predicted nucleic acid-binding protein
MLFIYLLEANPTFGPRVQRLYEEMLRRGDTLCTGVFTIGEVLTGPRKRNDRPGIVALKKFFSGKDIEVLPFNLEAADRYGMIRATMRVGQADAIHLATAAAAGIDLFITNDSALRKLTVPGIRFFADLDGRVI